MRSLILGIATLALTAVAASPAISASYESGYLGEALAATGLIQREEAPTCRATASDFQDGIAVVMDSGGRFKEAVRIGNDSDNFTCIN